MAITILDIAQAAKVSHSTVSRALNNSPLVSLETRERIAKIAKEMNYVPNMAARNLVANQSGIILLLVSESISAYPSSFSYEIMDGINSVLPQTHTLVYRKINSARAIDEMLLRIHCDGIFFVYLSDADEEMISHLPKLNLPFVVLNKNTQELGAPCVYADEYAGIQAGIEHLIGLGHRRIAHIQGSPNATTTQIRSAAYLNTLRKQGIVPNRNYLVGGSFQADTGYQAMETLLKLKQPPTAVCTANDLIAVGALKACAALGRSVPGDISILGFDDMEFSQYLIPSLTTIRKDKRDLGIHGGTMLMDIIQGKKKEPEAHTLHLSMVLRESCAPPA